jgi:hypothetical protein
MAEKVGKATCPWCGHQNEIRNDNNFPSVLLMSGQTMRGQCEKCLQDMDVTILVSVEFSAKKAKPAVTTVGGS